MSVGFVCAIEGLWHVGKTTLCLELTRDRSRADYVAEPDHLGDKSFADDIQLWYLNEWRKRAQRVASLRNANRLVVMERTFYSTLAFMQAMHRPLTDAMREIVKVLRTSRLDLVLILDTPIDYLETLPEGLATRYMEAGVPIADVQFLSRYCDALLSLIQSDKVPYQAIPAASPANIYHDAIRKLAAHCGWLIGTLH